MARRYSVAAPNIGRGGADLIRAGGGGVSMKAPKATKWFSSKMSDEGLEALGELFGKNDAIRKRLVDTGIYTQEAVDRMSRAELNSAERRWLEGGPDRAKAEAEADILEREANVLKDFAGIEARPPIAPVDPVDPEMEPFTFGGLGEFDPTTGDPVGGGTFDEDFPPEERAKDFDFESIGAGVRTEGVSPSDGIEEEFFEGGGIKERTNWKDGLRHGDNIEYHEDGTTKKIVKYEGGKEVSKESFEKPDYSKMSRQEALLARFMQTVPGVTQKVVDDYNRIKKDLTPKEVDPWTHSASMKVEGKDGKNYHMTYDKDGKELRKIKLPDDDIEWVDMHVWKGDQQGSFLRDKDDPQNYIKGKDGKPKFFPLPKGFSRVRPRAEKSLSMKFNAFLETNVKYKHLVGDPKVLKDPKVFYLSNDPMQQQAAIEFFQTKDGTVALIEALTKLQESRNKSDSKRNKKIDDLIRQKEGR